MAVVIPSNRGDSVKHSLLKRLYAFEHEILPPGSYSFEAGLGTLGLNLNKELDASRYDWCTPENCTTFAHTGGEDLHFSLLHLDSEITDSSPVVITNPGCGGHTCLVGEDLFDFLCLGYYRGYFALEQLAYDLKLTLEVFTNAEWQPSERDHRAVGYCLGQNYCNDFWGGGEKAIDPAARVLRLLIEAFGLRPWQTPAKFAALQDRYMKLLRAPPGFDYGT